MLRTRAFGVALAVLALSTTAVGCASSSTGTGSSPASTAGSLGPLSLGVNVAAWDGILTGADSATAAGLITSAGLRLLRYPGGSWADEYDWSTNTDSSACHAATSCPTTDPLDFDTFSSLARSVRAQSFVTINYGSGTPAQAAGWVAHATAEPSTRVALWEVGNEGYSCFEVNHHLAGSPTFVTGYTPDGPVCPSTEVMAKSYAAGVVPYLTAMERADPRARIGVPWAFTGTEAAGAGVVDAAGWNRTVLRAVRGHISFVDAHWYPFDQSTGVSDQEIVASVRRIPAAADRIHSTLGRDAPGAGFVVGETNISERPTTIDFRPVSALFAAAAVLEWLTHGAESVDWWDLNNFGSPTAGDYGLVSSGPPETGPAGTPLPPYYGVQLASRLTSVGSRLSTLDVGASNLYGFQSDLHGTRTVLLVNADPGRAATIDPRWFAASSDLRVETYSASSAAGPSPVQQSSTSADRPVRLPAQSIVVLSGSPRP